MYQSLSYNKFHTQAFGVESMLYSPVHPKLASSLLLAGLVLINFTTTLTNLMFLRFHMIFKELNNECQNYQWRRNRQGHT